MSARTPAELSNRDLLECFTDMVRWDHYDPLCTPDPCPFSQEELRAELRRRLDPPVEQADTDED